MIICYDVNTETAAGRRRLTAVAKACKDYGQRVQNSVFECLLEPPKMVELKSRLTRLIEPETDSLRFYYLGDSWREKVEHIGAKKSIDLQGALIA